MPQLTQIKEGDDGLYLRKNAIGLNIRRLHRTLSSRNHLNYDWLYTESYAYYIFNMPLVSTQKMESLLRHFSLMLKLSVYKTAYSAFQTVGTSS